MTAFPYIPTSRQDLVESLCRSDLFVEKERTQFRQFCGILSTFAHFTGQKDLELMKFAFAELDPNDDVYRQNPSAPDNRNVNAELLIKAFDRTLTRANYQRLGHDAIRAALNKASITPVQTAVDFYDYETFAFYYRTSNEIDLKVKKWFRTKTLTVGNYDRMAVLLQVKDAAYYKHNEGNRDDELIPGKIYLYLYKNIPHHDLELLFPNLKIIMNFKDKLMLAIPAFGAAVPLALKILPSVGLLVGAISLVVFGMELGGDFSNEDTDKKAVYGLLTALLSITLALGGFAARQFLKYKSRRLEFLKKVADVLFFKTLDVGRGVLSALVDSAEEEECKEMILVYYVLPVEHKSMDEAGVAQSCESWLAKHYNATVNFDTAQALKNLAAIRSGDQDTDISIVSQTDNGTYTAVDIDVAKRRIDQVWDNAFRF